jgi:hypothetical protein
MKVELCLFTCFPRAVAAGLHSKFKNSPLAHPGFLMNSSKESGSLWAGTELEVSAAVTV